MKYTALFISLLFLAPVAKAQTGTDTLKTDTLKAGKKKQTVTITIRTGVNKPKDAPVKEKPQQGFLVDVLTFARFDLGFTRLIDNGSSTLSAANEFLTYKAGKSSNVGFDVLQVGYKFNKDFRIYLSGGIDWTHLRLQRDITMLPNAPALEYTPAGEGQHFSKNRFSSTYLRIPLSFDYSTLKVVDKKGAFHIVAGPEIGFLLGGKVKQVSDLKGKEKFKDNYHFSQVRYGGFIRAGYNGFGIYAKFYGNDMFENSPAQEGLKNMSFGVMIGF